MLVIFWSLNNISDASLPLWFEPVVGFNKHTNEVVKVIRGDSCWLLKRYQGRDAQRRRNVERQRLNLWRSKGYSVPALYDIEFADETDPYLVLEWIEGVSLAQYLNDQSQSIAKRLQQLETIIKDIYCRQIRSLQEQDYDLIHFDPNTGNILIRNDTHFFIDLEARVATSPKNINEALAIELAKFLRWSIRDIGRQYLGDVINMTGEIYGRDNPIIATLVQRVYRPPLQFLHRRKDKRKKRNKPSEVTKYDLADGFRSIIVS